MTRPGRRTATPPAAAARGIPRPANRNTTVAGQSACSSDRPTRPRTDCTSSAFRRRTSTPATHPRTPWCPPAEGSDTAPATASPRSSRRAAIPPTPRSRSSRSSGTAAADRRPNCSASRRTHRSWKSTAPCRSRPPRAARRDTRIPRPPPSRQRPPHLPFQLRPQRLRPLHRSHPPRPRRHHCSLRQRRRRPIRRHPLRTRRTSSRMKEREAAAHARGGGDRS